MPGAAPPKQLREVFEPDGILVVTTVPTHLIADAHDERDECGLADAKVEAADFMIARTRAASRPTRRAGR